MFMPIVTRRQIGFTNKTKHINILVLFGRIFTKKFELPASYTTHAGSH